MAEDRLSAADIGDHHRNLIALVALALAGYFGTSAFEPIVSAEAATALHWIGVSLALVALLLLLPIVVWKLRNRDGEVWKLYQGNDGYVADILAKAHMASWGATFLLLVALSRLDRKLAHLPPESCFAGVAAFMLAVFSLVFLYLNRPVGAESEEG